MRVMLSKSACCSVTVPELMDSTKTMGRPSCTSAGPRNADKKREGRGDLAKSGGQRERSIRLLVHSSDVRGKETETCRFSATSHPEADSRGANVNAIDKYG